MISIRKQMDDGDRLAGRFRTLVNAFLGVTAALPKTMVPPSPELTRNCREEFEQITAPLKASPEEDSIEAAGKGAIQRIEEIARTNKAALEEIDTTMKEVVSMVAAAVSGFRSHGERHETGLTRLADGFDSLARVEDVAELRRRLRDDVLKLRTSVEEMRRESEESVKRFESQITVFQRRLDAARRGSDIDRLTGLGSRRVAERYLQAVPKLNGSVCLLLFDIEDFRKINARYGAMFGDKLLQALSHLLRESFPEEGTLFRWGADEFLAIAAGSLPRSVERCQVICDGFANSNYVTYERGQAERVAAAVSWGAVQYKPGESIEGLCLRVQENLDQNRRNVR
jgi:diguanylate cyclase (GGDEF)-like protein